MFASPIHDVHIGGLEIFFNLFKTVFSDLKRANYCSKVYPIDQLISKLLILLST